jgi:hypothetical protein
MLNQPGSDPDIPAEPVAGGQNRMARVARHVRREGCTTRCMFEHPRKPDVPRPPAPDIIDAPPPDINPAPPPDIPPQPMPDRPEPHRDVPGPA